MTKTQALQSLFDQFGIPCYPSGNVPEDKDIAFPYMTYTKGVGSTYESTLHYYDYTESELDPDNAIETICKPFRDGGTHIAYDGGVIWAYLSHGSEWYASADEGDRYRKHRLVDITLDFEGD